MATAGRTADATVLCPIALPIIHDALDTSHGDHSFLAEDSLRLWLILLRWTATYNVGFDVLFGRVNDTLVVDFEHIKMLCLIAEMYVYLGGTAFLDSNGKALGRFLNVTIRKVRPAGACWVYSVCEASAIAIVCGKCCTTNRL